MANLCTTYLLQRRKDLRTLEKEREAKMARFREKKARDARLKELQPLLDEENVDEHVKVWIYRLRFKSWNLRISARIEC